MASIQTSQTAPTTNGANASSTTTTASSTAPLLGGVVRSCPSGDALIVRPRGVATPGAEKMVYIAGISAPRMGSRDRDDEPFAFRSREFLRKLLVGREVRYRVEYTVPIAQPAHGVMTANTPSVREYAHVFLPPDAPGTSDVNVSHRILAAGFARVHESASRRQTTEEEAEGGYKAVQRTVQEQAEADKVGLWGPDDLLQVNHNLSQPAEFLAQWKGREIDSVVEQVRDGSLLRVRLLLSPQIHQIVSLSVAGVKAPRLTTANGTTNGAQDKGEPFAEEARFFVESRLLQRNVKVTLLGLPQATAPPTPFAAIGQAETAQSNAPTSSLLIGTVLHPVGDIAQFLLAAGLARCVDWHAGLLANTAGGMEKYRMAEKAAKEKQLNVWQGYRAPAKMGEVVTSGGSGGAAAGAPMVRNFEATVVRILSGDTLFVRRNAANGASVPEQRISLSSIRQPSTRDDKQSGYALEAREWLRKRLVGKPVQVRIDYVKQEANGETRLFATVTATTGAKETRDVGHSLISRGLATVTRHRAGDEDRAPAWDALMALETEGVSNKVGLHSGKELAAPRYVEASESAGKANAYLATLKRSAKIHAVVDFCAAAGRFKLIVPKENCRLTLVLAGIRAPRVARNANEQDEPFSRQGLEWSTAKALQRDVECEVYSIDKAGGFVGAMYLNNRADNLALRLVEAGLAQVHHYSAETLSFGPQLIEAEERAKAQRLGLWSVTPVEEAEAEGEPGSEAYGQQPIQGQGWGQATNGARSTAAATSALPAPAAAATPQYIDIAVSDVRGDGGASVPFGFSIQILDDRVKGLEKLMDDLSVSQRSQGTAKAVPTARVGDWVVAKFSGDGQWYRGQVLRNKPQQKAREILFVDYGNVEDVPFDAIRALDETRFGKRTLPAQSYSARLSYVKLYEGRGVQASTAGATAATSNGGKGGAPAWGKQAAAAAPAPVTATAAPDEYALEALDRFRELAEGRKLIANVVHRDANGTLHLTLYDPHDATAQGGLQACLNADLCREGHAVPDKRLPYYRSDDAMVQAINTAHQEARRLHRGMFELGDPTGDE